METGKQYLTRDKLDIIKHILTNEDYQFATDRFHNNESKFVLQDWLLNKDYRYFLTITFAPSSIESDSDRNLQLIMKILSKRIFGKNHIKKDTHMDYFVVRETDAYNIKSHYHLLIEDHPHLTLNKIAKGLIYTSRRLSCMNDLYDNDRHSIMKKTNLSDENADHNSHINIVEMKTMKDRKRVVEYVCKDFYKFSSSYVFSLWSKNGYEPINTRTSI